VIALNFAGKVQLEIRDADRQCTDNIDAVIDPFDWAVIVHEAAHLTIGARLGLDVHKVGFIWEDEGLNGYSHIAEGSRLSNWLTVLLAGEIAEVEFFGKQVLPRVHVGSDRERLYRAVTRAGRMGEQAHLVAKQQCPRLVHTHRASVLQLSHDLLALVHDAQGQSVLVKGPQLAALLDVDGSAILRRTAV
jgi:hypothetical protein